MRFAVTAFFMPSLLEEAVFRVYVLPHPAVDGEVSLVSKLVFAVLSVSLFVVYHLSPFHEPKEVQCPLSLCPDESLFMRCSQIDVS